MFICIYCPICVCVYENVCVERKSTYIHLCTPVLDMVSASGETQSNLIQQPVEVYSRHVRVA